MILLADSEGPDLRAVWSGFSLFAYVPSRKHAYIILTPLKPHFYIVKLGFTGVYIIFLISGQKRRGGSNEYPQSMFWAEIWKKKKKKKTRTKNKNKKQTNKKRKKKKKKETTEFGGEI